MTPEQLRAQILAVLAELKKAPDYVRDYELAVEAAEAQHTKAFDLVFLSASGSVEERKALARQACSESLDGLIVARATYNRAKLKVKQLESELMGLQSVLKSVQLEGA